MYFYDIYARNRRIPMSRWVSRTKGVNPGNFDSESRKCPEKLWHVWLWLLHFAWYLILFRMKVYKLFINIFQPKLWTHICYIWISKGYNLKYIIKVIICILTHSWFWFTMKFINSSSPGDAYSRHCCRRLLKTLWPKEILLKLSNISFGNNVFNIIWQIYLSVFRSLRFLLICLKSRLLQICFRCWRVNNTLDTEYNGYKINTKFRHTTMDISCGKA